MTHKTALAMLATLGLVVTACGTGAGVAAPTTTTLLPTTTTSLATTSTTTASQTTTTVMVTTTTLDNVTTTTVLRGDPVDLGPPVGAELAVIGVAHDDVLNLRAAPGADQPILAGIPPTFDSLIALGETRSLPAFWTQVRYRDTEGWVNMAYLGYIGATDDITSRVISLFGERPEADSMEELGATVAEALASDDPSSRVVQVTAAGGGDLGEIGFDVIGLGDDSVRGFRLHFFAEETAQGYTLRTLEQTLFCDPARGVDEDGTCV